MSVARSTTTIVAILALTAAGWAVAGDDSFESLLQEISQPSPTQQPTAAEMAAPTDFTAAEPASAESAQGESSLNLGTGTEEQASSEDIGAAPAESVEATAPESEAAAIPSEEPAAEVAPEAAGAAAATFEAESPATEGSAEMPAATEEAAPAPMEEFAAPAAEEQPPAATVEAAPEAMAPAEEAPAPMEEAASPFEPAPAPIEEVAAPVEETAPTEEGLSPEQAAAAGAAVGAAAAMEAAAPEAAAEEEAVPEVPAVTAADAKELARQEEIRRQARETQARMTLDSGLKSVESKDYDAAIKDLELALADLPDRPSTKELREQARQNLAAAYERKASALLASRTNLSDALTAAEKAKEYGYRDADALIARIKKEQARQDEIARRPIPPAQQKEYKDKQSEIAALLTQGRQYYKIGEYNAAESVYEKVLIKDEYNTEAMRYLRKIDEIRYDIKTTERSATEAAMIQKVRDSWNPPIREEVSVPGAVVGQTTVEKKTAAQKLQERMEKITFPLIDFRQANIIDVVKFLNDESATLDPEGVGVNIILKLNMGGATDLSSPAPTPEFSAPAQTEDLFGDASTTTGPAAESSEPLVTGPSSSAPSITLSLRRVSLLNAIKYITEVANLKYRIDEDAVIITPEGVVQGRVITRLYPVQPTFLDVVIEKGDTGEQKEDRGEFVAMGSANTQIKKSDVREFFERSGVPFPVGTSITFNPGISQLIVANTPENLEIFERILSQLNIIPSQVEIEARFVEIGQDDLEELGLQWILTDNYELAQRTGTGNPISGTERIQVNKDLEGFSKGLRFFEFAEESGTFAPSSTALGLNPVGDVATIASVLTNPELTVVIQALSQHGGSDLLSAPRVTTRSGVNAQIQVVREIIYPTEFETTQPQFSNSAGDTQIVTPPLVTPGSFETRETGVILNVTPTVGPDGYTIDLTMVPEVTELVEWINYGSTFGVGPSAFTFNIPQPVFQTRKVTTSIVIWDGQTVVMGGLINEVLIKTHDKIPILGDIPLLGHLFRSDGEFSKKKNLLIFVTARLVDPAGKTLHKASDVGAGGAEGEPETTASATP